ncbi:YceI family protein [Streptomyces sp. H27-C3]|uniref:YceI family protein n=1 Tax=Streptomyces sp. H27-C3 TaxID=3046305 RepID=UPI0024BACB4C|nr:YceI family protein [Streptomyces sp. H27-C3]MDJ0467111.1 YceI family protein [Streptomyces sp. H27-C3]
MSQTAANSLTVPAPGTYTIDSGRSTVTFRTRHAFGLGGVDGAFSVLTGQIRVAAEATESGATAVIDADSFTTGNDSRDKVVRSDKYLATAAHPCISFTFDAVRESQGTYTLHGELTVRATTQPVELSIEQSESGPEGIRFRATTKIDRYAFGITADKGMTARYLTLNLDIVASPA